MALQFHLEEGTSQEQIQGLEVSSLLKLYLTQRWATGCEHPCEEAGRNVSGAPAPGVPLAVLRKDSVLGKPWNVRTTQFEQQRKVESRGASFALAGVRGPTCQISTLQALQPRPRQIPECLFQRQGRTRKRAVGILRTVAEGLALLQEALLRHSVRDLGFGDTCCK